MRGRVVGREEGRGRSKDRSGGSRSRSRSRRVLAVGDGYRFATPRTADGGRWGRGRA